MNGKIRIELRRVWGGLVWSLAKTNWSIKSGMMVLIGLILFGGGCQNRPLEIRDDAARLALAIETLSPVVDPHEAKKCAAILTRESERLAETYEITGPAWFHNILVNSGFRQRGLCYHWVNDLIAELQRESFRSLVIYRGGSKLGTFQEHNVIVIGAYGERFEDGLVVDAWRHQGRLYWIRVRADKVRWLELVPSTE